MTEVQLNFKTWRKRWVVRVVEEDGEVITDNFKTLGAVHHWLETFIGMDKDYL